MVISKTWQIDLKGLLSYSLTLSISTASGDLVKTAKSKMFQILEEANNPVVYVERFRDGNTLTIDAMPVLQVMKGK